MSRKRAWSAWFWPVSVLVTGLLIALAFLWTAPQTRPEDKISSAKIVQTLTVVPGEELITVTAYGPVIPARKVVMRPEVRGRVVRHHERLVPGGYIKAGEELIGIDPSDYMLALTEQEAALEEAKFELAVEKGRQVVASREWRLLEEELADSEVNRALVLREPHLRRTEAKIRMATNEIAKAKLDLSRTAVFAPFNAIVLEESVEIGQLVEPGNAICTLVGTDEFWVQATLPLDKLKWIRLPTTEQAGATAAVILDTGNGASLTWTGAVVRLLADLEPTGRMARVLVQVTDPMGHAAASSRMPLLLESYVRVDLQAGRLRDVLAIPRSALREGNRIWVVDTHQELQVRDAEILWTREETLLLANCMRPGEQLVVSGLKVGLPGMKVDPQPLAEPAEELSAPPKQVLAPPLPEEETEGTP